MRKIIKGYWVDGRFITLKRGFKKAKVRKPIRKVSKKLGARLRTYSVQRVEFLKAHPFCEFLAGATTCNQRSCDIHHTAGRIGDKLLDEANWIALCRACHDWVHRNPSKAREFGMLK